VFGKMVAPSQPFTANKKTGFLVTDLFKAVVLNRGDAAH